MCLIIKKAAGVELSDQQIESIYENNDDGLGVMFSKEGRVIVDRSMPKNSNDAIDFLRRYPKEMEMGIHFRFKTHGANNITMCHPFQVFSKDNGDPEDLYVMHNGILSTYTIKANEERSDTALFVGEFLRPFLKESGGALLFGQIQKEVLSMIGNFIGNNNKLLFLNGKGEFAIVNELSGNKTSLPGCWLSNTYSLQTGYRETKTYNTTGYTKFWQGWKTPKEEATTIILTTDKEKPWGTKEIKQGSKVVDIFKPPTEELPLLIPPPPKKTEEPITQKDQQDPASNDDISELVLGPFDLMDLSHFEFGDIFSLVVEYPEDAAYIIDSIVTELVYGKAA